MIKAIFLDSGNVLAEEDFAKGIKEYESINSIPSGQLYKAVHDFGYWKDFSLGKISEKEYFNFVTSNFKGELVVEKLRNSILASFYPNLELVEFLKKLKKERNIVIGVISNNPKEWFDYFMNKYGWQDLFDIKAVSGYLHIRKPDIKIFEYALKASGLNAPDTVYVDNREEMTEGAKFLGMNCIIYKNFYQFIKEYNKLIR
jgi:putative hydrolase of the HAD superfamily